MRRSIYFTAPGRLTLTEEAFPEPLPGGCLVRNDLSLISPGTELALFTGTHVGFKDLDIAWARYPLLPGYSTVGEVLRTNGDCPLDPGDRVLYYGPHSTHGVIDLAKDCWSLVPPGLDEACLFARFAQISSTVPYLARQRPGNVLVFGAGLIGNFCAQLFARDRERTVMIADLSEKRLTLAASCGISRTILSGEQDPAEAVREHTGSAGADLIVEATGVPGLVSAGLELVNPMGAVYLLGSSRGEVTLNAYKHIHRKGVSLIGAHESVVERLESPGESAAIQAKLQEMVAHLAAGGLTTQGMITHRIRPAQAQEYYNHLLEDRDRYLGVLIDWREEL